MTSSGAVIETTEATFERDVLERSHAVPVVVDFWAAWCGPCRALSPILERLAGEADGDWVLAKIDVDANPRLASAAGVQGIPAVRAFVDGKQVAEFTGALPEPQVRAWLRGFTPSPTDLLVDRAVAHESAGDLDAAAESYRAALADEPGNRAAAAGLARIDLARSAAASDEPGLRERIARDPTDVDAALQLADLDMHRGETERALEGVLDVIARNDGEIRERARLHLLKLMDALPADDPHALAARRRLASLLY